MYFLCLLGFNIKLGKKTRILFFFHCSPYCDGSFNDDISTTSSYCTKVYMGILNIAKFQYEVEWRCVVWVPCIHPTYFYHVCLVEKEKIPKDIDTNFCDTCHCSFWYLCHLQLNFKCISNSSSSGYIIISFLFLYVGEYILPLLFRLSSTIVLLKLTSHSKLSKYETNYLRRGTPLIFWSFLYYWNISRSTQIHDDKSQNMVHGNS